MSESFYIGQTQTDREFLDKYKEYLPRNISLNYTLDIVSYNHNYSSIQDSLYNGSGSAGVHVILVTHGIGGDVHCMTIWQRMF